MVCDEGHILRNSASGISKALNAVKTRRRVVLTGTPLQNNLIECTSATLYCQLVRDGGCSENVPPTLLCYLSL